MDLFRMKCFISVAEHRNMSAAAREMFITRPAMTAQMNALESELGCVLLIRDRKGIRLTPAGERALETFKGIVPQLDSLSVEARRLNANVSTNLSIGFHGHAEWMHLYDLVNEFSRSFEHTSVEMVAEPWNELAEMVATGSLDVAFIELAGVNAAAGLASRALYDEGICVAVRADHPFARQNFVELDQLRDQNIVMPNVRICPPFFNDLKDRFARAGVRIYETGQGNSRAATIMLAATGTCITVVPRSFETESDAVAYIPLTMPEHIVHMGIVWREGTDNPAIERFVEACTQWPWESYLPSER